MTWKHEQSTGRMSQNGIYAGTGYAGKGVHKNNPDSEDIDSYGPLPRGEYSIGPAYHHKGYTGQPALGPVTMNLDPTGGQNMYGRGPFRIHGDNTAGDASKGCIVINRNVREKIRDSGDTTLDVVR